MLALLLLELLQLKLRGLLGMLGLREQLPLRIRLLMLSQLRLEIEPDFQDFGKFENRIL